MKKVLATILVGIGLQGCGFQAEFYYPKPQNAHDADLYQTHLAGCKQSVLASHSYRLDADVSKVRPRIDACLRARGYEIEERKHGVMLYGADKRTKGTNWFPFDQAHSCRNALRIVAGRVQDANPQVEMRATYHHTSATLVFVGRIGERWANASLHCVGLREGVIQ